MKYAQGKIGRIFMLRMEDGDLLPDSIESFAEKQGISVGQVLFMGGIGSGDIVVGPRDSSAEKPQPMVLPVDGAHEILATGVLAPDEETNQPILHIHGALGRGGRTITGCLREGVYTWLIGEVVVYEILGIEAKRVIDSESGFKLLQVEKGVVAHEK